MIPRKFPKIPNAIFNQQWEISIDQEGISEDGEPLTESTVTASVYYSSKAHQIMNAEKQIIRLEGALIALGDIFPDMSNISTGTAKKGDKIHKIYKCERPLNPDGSVYATIMELM